MHIDTICIGVCLYDDVLRACCIHGDPAPETRPTAHRRLYGRWDSGVRGPSAHSLTYTAHACTAHAHGTCLPSSRAWRLLHLSANCCCHVKWLLAGFHFVGAHRWFPLPLPTDSSHWRAHPSVHCPSLCVRRWKMRIVVPEPLGAYPPESCVTFGFHTQQDSVLHNVR